MPGHLKLKLIFFALFLGFNFSSTLSHAQSGPVRFEKKEIQVGKKKLIAEFARSDAERALGLMYRTTLSDSHGMLFIFEREQTLSFWMKNTYISLSIGFFDSKRVLVDIQDMEATPKNSRKPPASYTSKKPAQYALEVNKGWFKKNGIKPGDRLQIP